MKIDISDEEIQAALEAYYGTPKLAHLEASMREALKAAFRVRKQEKQRRKQARMIAREYSS